MSQGKEQTSVSEGQSDKPVRLFGTLLTKFSNGQDPTKLDEAARAQLATLTEITRKFAEGLRPKEKS